MFDLGCWFLCVDSRPLCHHGLPSTNSFFGGHRLGKPWWCKCRRALGWFQPVDSPSHPSNSERQKNILWWNNQPWWCQEFKGIKVIRVLRLLKLCFARWGSDAKCGNTVCFSCKKIGTPPKKYNMVWGCLWCFDACWCFTDLCGIVKGHHAEFMQQQWFHKYAWTRHARNNVVFAVVLIPNIGQKQSFTNRATTKGLRYQRVPRSSPGCFFLRHCNQTFFFFEFFMVSRWAWLLAVGHKVLAGWAIFKWRGWPHGRTFQVDCGAHFERDWEGGTFFPNGLYIDRVRHKHSKKIVFFTGLMTHQRKKSEFLPHPKTTAPRKLMRIVRTSKVPLGRKSAKTSSKMAWSSPETWKFQKAMQMWYSAKASGPVNSK